MNEVKVPEMFETEPTVSRKQDANGLGSRLSIAYKMWSRIKHPMDTGGSHSLQSLYNLLGVPQRFEWVSDHPAAQRMLALKEVSHEESVAQTLLLHYGDGHVAVMPTKVQRGESLPPNPNLQMRVVGISRASAAAMAAGTQSQSWPVFGPSTHVPDQVGRPFFLDSARYKHIQTGDPIAWVLYVLGLPTAVERVGEERDPAGFTTLKYGPVEVAGEKWFSGKIRINRSGAVIGIEAPTKK
jgi:hypothetical protein